MRCTTRPSPAAGPLGAPPGRSARRGSCWDRRPSSAGRNGQRAAASLRRGRTGRGRSPPAVPLGSPPGNRNAQTRPGSPRRRTGRSAPGRSHARPRGRPRARAGGRPAAAQDSVTPTPTPPRAAVKVLSQYPQSCVRAVRWPTGAGRGAVLNTGTETIASPAGGDSDRYPVQAEDGSLPRRRPIGRLESRWPLCGHASRQPVDIRRSVSREAFRHSRDRDVDLEPRGRLRPRGDRDSDIAGAGTISVGTPGRSSRPYLSGHIAAYAFAPNGRGPRRAKRKF
jgi:hypothetical protein